MPLRCSSTLYQSFVAVVKHGSITAAARDLGLPRPTLSRHLSKLEAELGIVLLHRTTRRVWVTAAGQHLFDRVGPLLEGIEATEEAVTSEAAEAIGVVRVSVLPVLAPHVAPVIAHLVRTHPRLQIEAVMNVRLVDLRSEGFDVAIWAGEPRDPELIVRTLSTGRVGLVATPAYLDEHGRPETLEDLADHTLLRGHDGTGRPRRYWPLFAGGKIEVGGPVVTNDAPLLRASVLTGLGIALLSDLSCGDALRDGRLERVLPDRVGRTATVRTITAQRHAPTRVRVFLDAMATHFATPGP